MSGRFVRIGGGLVLLVMVLLVLVVPAAADGVIIPEPPPDVPIVDVPWLTIKYHRVTVTIEDQVATTRVDQVFVNEASYEVEGTYIFPLPDSATISEFTMWVDGVKLEGQVLNRDEARRIYEDIVRQRQDPALLEYVGHDAFQASIYPIPPHGERRIELEYSQVLPVDNGLVEYVYPLSTEKFSPQPLEEVTINVSLQSREPIKAIYSPSHKIDVVRQGDNQALVGYEELDVIPDRDFVLYYTVSSQDVGVNLLTYAPEGRDDGFFLLLAAPNVEVEAEQVIARDVILVLDVSGSMRGEKVEQAKEALRFVLDNLNDEDRFNIITFSTSTDHYEPDLVPAAERERGQDYVARLEANGSTDINRALLEAVAMAGEERPAIVVFITDGLPTVGEVEVDRIIRNVSDAAPDNVRIFGFGVGYDVNTTLLDTIAQNHGGASGYVRPEESIDEKISAFYAKVSTPLLSNVEIDWGGAEVSDVYPYPLPDLFAGTQLVVVGRYQQGGPATITLSGEVNGRRQAFEYGDQRFRDEGGEDLLPRLWATRKIGYLLQQIRLNGEQSELVDEIVDLSVRYGIITPYTSFLVEEPGMALREEGRAQIVETVVVEAEAAPAPATSGEDAVNRSLQEKDLAAAEAPAAMPTMVAGAGDGGGAGSDTLAATAVKSVGPKTFVLHEGVWTDTAFDPDRLETVAVGLGSDDYFDLIAARPEWGRYFALGSHVIVVLEGTAYEVRAGDAPPLDLPAPGAEPTVTAVPASTPEPAGESGGNLFQSIADAILDFFHTVAGLFR